MLLCCCKVVLYMNAKDLFLKDRLMKLRKEKGLSFKKLSDELKEKGVNISPDALAKYERGVRTPKIDKIISLANYFDVPVAYLQGNVNTNKLDELLKQKNISKKQISKDLHIPLIKIVDYASNRKEIPVYDGVNIANYLGVSLNELQGSEASSDFVLCGVDLFKLSSEIDNKFMRASTSNDRKELIKLLDEIIDMLKETKKNISNYDKKLNNTSDETTDKD